MVKKDARLMKAVILLIALSSFSLCFAAVVNHDGTAFERFAAIAVGLIFWISLIAGYVILFIISGHRKAYERSLPAESRRKARSKKQRPGVITFFSSPAAFAADCIMILFFILTLVLMFIPGIIQTLLLICIAVLVFAIQMHSILNGINFKYISNS